MIFRITLRKKNTLRLGNLLLPLLVSTYTASAQLTITSTAELFVIGDMQLTLHNTDLINNGIFSPGVNTTSFTGEVSSSIRGNGPIRFFQLEVNKTGNRSLVLQKRINIVDQILFTSGFLDLNGFDADLETTGHLTGEKEGSRVTGANGGQVLFRAVLNAPSNANPGNLGAVVTTTKNLGNVTIKRGHQSQSGNGLSGSVLRYYDIAPDINGGLDAELKINYFDGELNGHDENSLLVFKSEDGTTWSNQGFTSENPIDNFVIKSGIDSLSRWTLSNPDNVLPILFSLFSAKCESNRALLTWKTVHEQNTTRFDIEKSIDGVRWTVIGNLGAAGNSNSEKSYFFTDNDPIQNSFYRIAVYDFNGRVEYSGVVPFTCIKTDLFTVWPNPARSDIFINITSSTASPVFIKVFDSKGALVKVQRGGVSSGNNQLRIDIGLLANGVYSLRAVWNNGQMQKTIQIVKQ